MTGRLVVMGAILVAVVAFGASAAFGSADRSTVGVDWHTQQASLGIERPVATPTRDANGTSYRRETDFLTASSAQTLRVVVVGNPATCDPSPCTAPDIIRNPATDLRVLFGSGLVASGSGKATLVLGPRHFGVVFVPEFVGASGGDLAAIESSPLVIGPRHTDGVVSVPVYVGHADGVFPENTR